MIEINRVSRAFAGDLAVKEISAKINAGEVVALLGANGAGKSTLMKLIIGLLEPDEGEIKLFGEPLIFSAKRGVPAWRRQIGYLPEATPTYPDMSVMDYLSFIAALHHLNDQAVRQSLNDWSLADVAHQTIGTLSRGTRQRLGLAQAFIHSPRLVLLDEPTNGLDPLQVQAFHDFLRQRAHGDQTSCKTTIVLSTHIMQEVRALCERALILRAGRLVADTTWGGRSPKLQKQETWQINTNAPKAQLQTLMDTHALPISLSHTIGKTPKNALGSHTYRLNINTENDNTHHALATINAQLIGAGFSVFALSPVELSFDHWLAEPSHE